MMYLPFMFDMFVDPYFWMILVAVLISAWASWNVNSTFNRYDQVENHEGLTGAQTAQIVLSNAGITDVTIQEVGGRLTDFYDPRNKTLNLSSAVYNSTSVSAVGVAAHEAGHAIQDARHYVPMLFRSALVPVVNLGSRLAMPLIFIGIIFGMNQTLIRIGIIAFAAVVVFQIATLPVEFNASHRALIQLKQDNILDRQEVPIARKVLFAAALTYVAAALGSILQLLRLVLLFGNNDNRN